MKKIIVLIMLVVFPAISFGQSVFDELENMDGVSSVIINKDAFQILQKFNIDDTDNEAMEIFKIIQNLELFKLFKTENIAISNEMESIVNTFIKKHNLTQLMRIKDKDSRVRVYVKAGKNKDYVSEVLMFISGVSKHTEGYVESAVLSLTGTIDINKLSKIADTYRHSIVIESHQSRREKKRK